MQLRLQTLSFAVCASVALGACSLAPTGTPPAMPSPVHYGAQPQPAATVTAGKVAQTFDVGGAPVRQWWRLYRSAELDALVDEGLLNSPTLASEQKVLAAAKEQLRAQIGSSTLPSIDAGADVGRVRQPGIPGVSGDTAQPLRYNVFLGQLEAHYTFDLFGATRYANQASIARVDAQTWELDAARRALAANIVGSVIKVASLDRQIALTERLVALTSATDSDDQKRYELGAISRAQALASTQAAASDAANLPLLREQRASAVHALAVLLGRSPDNAPQVPALGSLLLPEHVPVVVPSDLLRSRPDIEAAAAAVKASAADVGAATAQLFPSLSLTAAMGQGGISWPTVLSGAGGLWAIGAGLSQPIFHGGALLAQRRAALDTYDAALLNYKAVVLSAFENVADTLASLEHDAQNQAFTDQASRSARAALEDTAMRRRLGALPATAERASEHQYLTAQLDAVQAASRRLGDTAMLLQAMGELPPAENAQP